MIFCSSSFVHGPGPAGDLAAHRSDRRRRDGSGVLPPRAPHVGENVGDLLVRHAGAQRRHQPYRPFLAVEENASRDARRGERQLRSDQAGRQLLAPAAVRLVARFADGLVNDLPGLEALLLCTGVSGAAVSAAIPGLPGQPTRSSTAAARCPEIATFGRRRE